MPCTRAASEAGMLRCNRFSRFRSMKMGSRIMKPVFELILLLTHFLVFFLVLVFKFLKITLHLIFSAQCVHRMNHCAIAMMFRLSGMGVHCDHMVHFSADLSLWLDSPMFWAP